MSKSNYTECKIIRQENLPHKPTVVLGSYSGDIPLEKSLSDKFNDISRSCYYGDTIYFQTPVVGVAKCGDNDEYDPKIGLKVATFKAKLKGMKRVLKHNREMIDTLEKVIKVIEGHNSELTDNITDIEGKLSKF